MSPSSGTYVSTYITSRESVSFALGTFFLFYFFGTKLLTLLPIDSPKDEEIDPFSEGENQIHTHTHI